MCGPDAPERWVSDEFPRDGALLVSDDANGIIYRVTRK